MSALAIHIGVDNLDPAAYEGWDGALDAAENDARAMEEITRALGYDTQLLLTKEATSTEVLGAISRAATTLEAGDICAVTYAGHGGQLKDLDSEEPDQKDETWLLHDRELLDDELRAALSGFGEGVRVVVVSDSCHSGTMSRPKIFELYQKYIKDPHVQAQVGKVARGLRSRARAAHPTVPKLREIPTKAQEKVAAKHGAMYRDIRARTPRSPTMAASVILLAGCQDNQSSMEADGHGMFTAAVLDQWRKGSFTGSYRAVLATAVAAMPSDVQRPNFDTSGRPWPDFENQTAFEVAQPPRFEPQIGQNGTTPDEQPTQSAQPTTAASGSASTPPLSISIGVTFRPTDAVSEKIFSLLAASLGSEDRGTRRGLATLVLDTLTCHTPDDYGGDEALLTFNQELAWSGSGMDAGDSRDVGFRRAFSDAVLVTLYDEEIGVNDTIGTRWITSDEAGLGGRQAYFAGEGGARYTLSYHVE